MSQQWVTADTHFGHRNIIQYCRRPYETPSEMDEDIVRRWNSRVKPEDVVWFLGDFAFTDNKIRLLELFDALHGDKRLLPGNHDNHKVGQLPWRIVRDYVTLRVNDTFVAMFHYPLEDWHGREAGSVMLHGHSHGSARKMRGRLDVGVDCHGMKPILIEEAIYYAKNQ